MSHMSIDRDTARRTILPARIVPRAPVGIRFCSGVGLDAGNP